VTRFELTVPAARAALLRLAGDAADDAASLDRYARVAWCVMTEPGDSVAGRLIAEQGATGALRAVMAAPKPPGRPADEIARGLTRWLPRLSAQAVDDALGIADRRGVQLVTRADPEWPQQLNDLGDHAPICLWVRGRPDALTGMRPSVAIVGARAATTYGEHVAMELAADLAGGGIPVVSGGAYGIDGAAHRAAIHAGGLTVALLAGGADRAYPAGHSRLIEDVTAAGAVASEVPCGSAPTKWRFLQRNRLIAALSDATVVVEAGWRSGSLNTAGHAAALSRQLGAVPGPITSAASAGTHRLLREYGAHCITSAADVREMLGAGPEGSFPGGSPGDRPSVSDADGRPRTDDTTRVRDALSTRSWRTVAEVGRRAGMAVGEVEAILGLLELEDGAHRSAEGWRAGPLRR
jgi:DNA processing protein